MLMSTNQPTSRIILQLDLVANTNLRRVRSNREDSDLIGLEVRSLEARTDSWPYELRVEESRPQPTRKMITELRATSKCRRPTTAKGMEIGVQPQAIVKIQEFVCNSGEAAGDRRAERPHSQAHSAMLPGFWASMRTLWFMAHGICFRFQ